MPSRKRAPVKRKFLRTRASANPVELLTMEVYAVLCRALTLHGVSIARQKVLFKKSCAQVGKVTAVSAQLLEQFRSVSELLTAWLQELPYVDALGQPKVLPIRGRGATFESLARQFLPERSVDDVVALACQVGTVDKLSGGRIAVYGDPMINIAENPEATLAQAICHITNIIQTVNFNARRGRTDRSSGRLERIINASLTREQAEMFDKLMRPLLDDLSEHADQILKKLTRGQSRDKRRRAGGGVGIYIYHRDDGVKKAPAPPRTRTSRRR